MVVRIVFRLHSSNIAQSGMFFYLVFLTHLPGFLFFRCFSVWHRNYCLLLNVGNHGNKREHWCGTRRKSFLDWKRCGVSKGQVYKMLLLRMLFLIIKHYWSQTKLEYADCLCFYHLGCNTKNFINYNLKFINHLLVL